MEKIMSGKWVKVILLYAMMSGLCACAQPITTAVARDGAAPPHNPDSPVRVALMLPMRSALFGAAADAVRAGFLSAYDHKHDNLVVTIIETGDAAPDVLASYRDLSGKYDIIVGPLSRSAVTALAQPGSVLKPTIALAQPDLPDLPGSTGLKAGAAQRWPAQMLMMGLAIEDEARQVAVWVEHDKKPGKIFALSTSVAWQRRAANAFAQQSQRIGLSVDALELSLVNGALSPSGLVQLSQRIQAEKPALLFVALDAVQTIQLRNAIGSELPLYGTSQLNPLTLAAAARSSADKADANAGGDNHSNRLPELDGVHLVDMPWQLQADHPVVMTYQRTLAPGAKRTNADLARLYALGIDAFRVARQIAQQRSGFDIDGVTGQIYVNMNSTATYFQRRETQAVFQDGVAIPAINQH